MKKSDVDAQTSVTGTIPPAATPIEHLLSLLENATEGSRDLDLTIELLIGEFAGHPPYTTSLDAALSLVPEGLWWEVGRVCADDSAMRHFAGGNTHSAKVDKWGGFGRPSYAATPALALCIAALKARSAP